MADDKPEPVTVDVEELRKIEDESEPAEAKKKAPLEHPGDSGGTSGTGGTAHDQDR